MKIKLTIERNDGMRISSWEHDLDERGVEVVITASMADYAMTEGVTYEEIVAALKGAAYQGVRFRAEVTP